MWVGYTTMFFWEMFAGLDGLSCFWGNVFVGSAGEMGFTTPPLLGYHFGPLFGTRDSFFGGTQLFEGSSFGFRFRVRFGIHFVTENSSKRRPKRQEKEHKAREAKMWFGYGRRYTGGT